MMEDGATRLERVLGTVLRAGVLTAACVLLMGGGWYLAQHGTESPPDRSHFQPGQATGALKSVRGVWTADSKGLMGLGLLLVIATPLARVAVSACGFLFRRDFLYLGLTLVVLGVLLGSLFLAW